MTDICFNWSKKCKQVNNMHNVDHYCYTTIYISFILLYNIQKSNPKAESVIKLTLYKKFI